jgi:single-stranded-DNA-specific exonuclease
VLQILHNRDIRQPEQVRAFLDRRADLHDPFLLAGMEVAVERIARAIRHKELIAVYGDFDADGVTATALLTQTLNALDAKVGPYIPNRFKEGYGLNTAALDSLADRGVGLVVTVDCGIRSQEEVAHGNRRGLDTIVTDHHSVGAELPPALTVINPKRPDCAYPFTQLAGVGVAFKLAQALLGELDHNSSLREEKILDLVALGTVADIVPLRGENRTLVLRGLAQLGAPWRKGLQALMERARVKPEQINSTTIGFVLGPRINAAGRLQDAMLAWHLLMTGDQAKAEKYADRLHQLNQKRQRMTQETTERAEAQVLGESGEVPPLLFAKAPDFHPGIVGLVASRLSERFYRPSIVLELGGETSRASCRSIPEFHITHALDECADLLVRYGGHAAAAGFSVRNEDLPALEERLQRLTRERLAEAELIPKLHLDTELTLGRELYELYEALETLQPFGEGNPQPLFVTRGVRVKNPQAIGNEGSHLKFAAHDGRAWWDAVAFRRGDKVDRLPPRVDLAYHLDMNEWNGNRRLQLIVRDWRPAS